jgi:tetrahydromethanopterin S-methyltransferase subunit F
LIFEKYRGELWLIETVKKIHQILCRNVGLGAGIFWTRVGGIVAPQLSLLVRFAKMYRLAFYMPFLF